MERRRRLRPASALYDDVFAQRRIDANDIIPKIISSENVNWMRRQNSGCLRMMKKRRNGFQIRKNYSFSGAGDFHIQKPFHPTDISRANCPDCPYKFMCGTQWAEKFNVY